MKGSATEFQKEVRPVSRAIFEGIESCCGDMIPQKRSPDETMAVPPRIFGRALVVAETDVEDEEEEEEEEAEAEADAPSFAFASVFRAALRVARSDRRSSRESVSRLVVERRRRRTGVAGERMAANIGRRGLA